jgi:ribokinase
MIGLCGGRPAVLLRQIGSGEAVERMVPRRVVVIGSINVDEVVGVATLPAPGETVFGWERATGLGGKGANQAVAAAVAGGEVALIGAVGADGHGAAALEQLAEYGVDTFMVATLEGTASGRALVILSEDGENEIIVIGGANQALEERALSRDALRDAAVMVVQGEVPSKVNQAALRMAEELGVRAVVNLAPVQDLGEHLATADPLVVNEIEAGQLIGAELRGVQDVIDATPDLRDLARSVVVTLGASGAMLITHDAIDHICAPRPERVRDTTGAGDALAGVLATALAQGLELRAAVERAVRAASLSVTEVGAAASYEAFRGRLS